MLPAAKRKFEVTNLPRKRNSPSGHKRPNPSHFGPILAYVMRKEQVGKDSHPTNTAASRKNENAR